MLIVNTDGGLYQVIDAYEPGKELGNVFQQPIGEILESEAYRASLERSDALVEARCGDCPYRAVCNKAPILESRIAHPETGRCAIGFAVQNRIEDHLRSLGHGEAYFAQLLAETGEAVTAV